MLPSTAPTDAELVRRAQSGDKAAFDALVTRNESKVYGLCVRMLGNPEDAEDVLQEVFIKAYQSLPGFRGDSAFSTWLYRIATNACLMRIRRKKLDTVSLDQPIEQGADGTREVPDWTQDPASEVMNDELRAVLAQHINELAPDNRIVFVLRDIHGLTTEDTASVLGLTPPAVKSRLHRARLHLRERLSGYFSHGSAAA